MRPIRWVFAGLAAGLLLFLGVRAISFFPRAFVGFSQRDVGTPSRPHLDTTVFDQEAAGSSDLAKIVPDTGLAGLFGTPSDSLGIAKSKVSAIRLDDRHIPLYSLDLHKGVPLVARVDRICRTLKARGYGVLESTERPKAIYPWAMHVSHGDTVVAVVRARVTAPALDSTYSLHLLLWSRTQGDSLRLLERLPRGAMVALTGASYLDSSVRSRLRKSGLRPALAVALESSLYPVSRQEKERILLHHGSREINDRLLPNDSVRGFVEGVAVVDGDRGAGDPVLVGRFLDRVKDEDWWILDATGTPSSRISDLAQERSMGQLETPRLSGSSVRQALVAAEERAVSEGEAYLALPMDTVGVRELVSYLPSLARRGIVVSPWPVVHRRTKKD
ncbi:MAG TPA: hypothetical protein PKO15_18165 [Fibrobacteria bacterium]|nr:hypothetical protein [Fibrobacteria bacterium]